MNIFALDRDPVVAAQSMCDKHIVKMTTEYAQILSTILIKQGMSAPFRATHRTHPQVLWAERSSENWDWLVEHAKATAQEYTYRYGKVHKSEAVILYCAQNKPQFASVELTDFVQTMPEYCKLPDSVKAYRVLYLVEKARFARWTRRSPPKWWRSLV